MQSIVGAVIILMLTITQVNDLRRRGLQLTDSGGSHGSRRGGHALVQWS